MSTQPENKIGFGISRSHVDMGYGKFPYVIIRLHYGIYMQIPIHFVLSQRTKGPKQRKNSARNIAIKQKYTKKQNRRMGAYWRRPMTRWAIYH